MKLDNDDGGDANVSTFRSWRPRQQSDISNYRYMLNHLLKFLLLL